MEFSNLVGLDADVTEVTSSADTLQNAMLQWKQSQDFTVSSSSHTHTNKSSALKMFSTENDDNEHQNFWRPQLHCEKSTLVACTQLNTINNLRCVEPEIEVRRQAALQTLRTRLASRCEQLRFEPPSSEVFDSWLFTRRLFVDLDNSTFKGDPILPRGAEMEEDLVLVDYLKSQNVPHEKIVDIIQDLGRCSSRMQRGLARCTIMTRPFRVHHDKEGGVWSFRVGKSKMRLNGEHYRKLRSLYDHTVSAESLSTLTKTQFMHKFHSCVLSLLLRYIALEDTGMQAACPEKVFEVLHSDFDVQFECFASPLNAYYGRYCSAFPDVDAPFGSCGSFFQFKPTHGSFQANPPFADVIITAMKSHIELLLSQSEKPLSFVVIVPVWKKSVAWKALKKSCFVRQHIKLAQKCHGYCDGAQHRRVNRYKISTCDTSVLFLQNKAGQRQWPCSNEKIERLRVAFVSKHKDELNRLFEQRIHNKRRKQHP